MRRETLAFTRDAAQKQNSVTEFYFVGRAPVDRLLK